MAPRLRVASEEQSFMVVFSEGLYATAQIVPEVGLTHLSNDQSDDVSAVSLLDWRDCQRWAATRTAT